MSSKSHQTSNTKSLFYRDLASPISSSSHRSSRFATPSQAAAVSSLWRDNFSANSDNLLPPPIFTLDDRIDFSPEPTLNDIPMSPESYPDPKTPMPVRNYHSTSSLVVERSVVSGAWWEPPEGSEEKGNGSPVDGVVKMGALITVPRPREVARPEMRRCQVVPTRDGMMDEEWVTVYGFSPGDTNLVLGEFENCGVILKHVHGLRDANWMHILYQNRYDAQKALGKNGMQLNSVLIIGVKSVDPIQRQYLNDKVNNNSNHGGFMVSLPPQSAQVKSTVQTPMAASPCPQFLQNGGSTTLDAHRSTGAIAFPAKSVVSKVMDLMFGF